MHEIDPQSEDPQSKDRLANAMKRLAASSPQSASAAVANSLLGEFRRHHARRRQIRRTSIAVLAACIALIVSLVSLRNRPPSRPQTITQTPNSSAVPSTRAAIAPAPEISPAHPSSGKHGSPKTRKEGAVVNAANRDFLALPGYDPAVPADELRVVRVQVPASTLWQIGAPVSADAGTHRVTADVVVSQSGMPYAVRLVQ